MTSEEGAARVVQCVAGEGEHAVGTVSKPRPTSSNPQLQHGNVRPPPA